MTELISKGAQGLQDSQIDYVSREEYYRAYKEFLKSNEPMYDRNGFRLISKPTKCFKIADTYFAIAVASGTYRTYFPPFKLSDKSVDYSAYKSIISLGISVLLSERCIETLGIVWEDTDYKRDSFVYNIEDVTERFNEPGKKAGKRRNYHNKMVKLHIDYVSREEYYRAYKEFLKSNEPMYDRNGFRLISKPTKCFKIADTYFAIAVASGTYRTYFPPFKLSDKSVDYSAYKSIISLGISVLLSERCIETLGIVWEDTDYKRDSFVYNIEDVTDRFNEPGKKAGKRRNYHNKMVKRYIPEIHKLNNLTLEQWNDITRLEHDWFKLSKDGKSDFKQLLNRLRETYVNSSTYADTIVIFYTDIETGKREAYCVLEIQDNVALEYYRKSMIPTKSFEFITTVNLELLKDYGVDFIDFGGARTYEKGESIGGKLKKAHYQSMYDTKSKLPHSIYWNHNLRFNPKVWKENKYEETVNELF